MPSHFVFVLHSLLDCERRVRGKAPGVCAKRSQACDNVLRLRTYLFCVRLFVFLTKHDVVTVFGHTTSSLFPAAYAMKVQEGYEGEAEFR